MAPKQEAKLLLRKPLVLHCLSENFGSLLCVFTDSQYVFHVFDRWHQGLCSEGGEYGIGSVYRVESYLFCYFL